MKAMFLVVQLRDGKFMLFDNERIPATEEAANQTAEALARANPDRRIFVAQLVTQFVTQPAPVIKEDLR